MICVRPRYTHDCDVCTYLGEFERHGVIFDLYACRPMADKFPTMLARYGDDGPEYRSMSLEPELWDASLANINGPRASMYHCYMPELCEAWRRTKVLT